MTFLTFDGAGEDALGEVLLEEGKDNEDRDKREDQDGHLDGGLRWHALHDPAQVSLIQLRVVDHVGSQHQLERPFGTVIEIQQGIEEGVPVADCIEEAEGI